MHLKFKRNTRYSIQNARYGFTLIELLITIFLVSVGLIGVLAFFNSSLQSQFDAKNEVIAAGLAQEATELVRNIVENNFLNNDPKWYKEIANASNGNSSCDWLDIESLTDHKCWNSSDNVKKISVCIDTSNNRYYQCPNVSSANKKTTDFLRKVVITGADVNGSGVNLETGDCLNVLAIVGWPSSNSACASNINNCPYKTTSTDIICKPRQ
jgi:prepilin-type N-terminal cleavage/methylation domain-containing protein